jgi:quercetin dioxygenase-like cupin family protein
VDSDSLIELAREHLAQAREAHSGRSAHTVYGGQDHVLRQTLIALKAGAALDEHQSPGEATLQVLQGSVRLIAGEASQAGTTGDLLVIPAARHSLEVDEDSVVLLTVAKRP